MRILQVSNWHRNGGGSDFMARATAEVLRDAGHEVLLAGHDSTAYEGGLHRRLRAAVDGIYSVAGTREMSRCLREFAPDLVHVHELYPYHSPWVLPLVKRAGIPLVMTCHDFRLTCPIATHLRGMNPCFKCAGGNTAWCLIHNCRGSLAESAAYALRAGLAQNLGLFSGTVDRFIAPSMFLLDRLESAGIEVARLRLIPNMVSTPPPAPRAEAGDYAAFAGRVVPEKGIDAMLQAAASCGVPLRIAGGPVSEAWRRKSPHNVAWMGVLGAEDMGRFYQNARFLVMPSPMEIFGLVVIEGMMHGLPVLCADTGALPELVEEWVTGLHFRAGDADDLASKMDYLWNDAALCKQLGSAAVLHARARFSASQYRDQLLEAYGELLPAVAPRSASIVARPLETGPAL